MHREQQSENLRGTGDLASHDDTTTYRSAISQVRKSIKLAVPGIYSFNIPQDELDLAYKLLDKQEERKSMKITYNEDFNFVIRYMPGGAHEAASFTWAILLGLALVAAAPGHQFPPGLTSMGATTFQLRGRKKQADASVRPTASASRFPSVVVEVGSSESIQQLRIDMRLWIEDSAEIQLGILLSIDPPLPPHPTLPIITVELWRGFAPADQPRTHLHRMRQARMVWGANWTLAATPLFVLLSDIFRGQPPAAYNSDRVFLDTTNWRQQIINNYP